MRYTFITKILEKIVTHKGSYIAAVLNNKIHISLHRVFLHFTTISVITECVCAS